jgi:hypothetical protein
VSSRIVGRKQPDRLSPISSEILPRWIHAFDQSDLLCSRPLLDFRLSIDAIVHVLKGLVVYETVNAISAGELDLSTSVLLHAMEEGVGHTDINPARFAGQNIDIELAVKSQKTDSSLCSD